MKRRDGLAVAGEVRWDRPELLSSANLSRYSPVFLPRDTRSPSAGFSPCQRQSASHSLGHTSVKRIPRTSAQLAVARCLWEAEGKAVTALVWQLGMGVLLRSQLWHFTVRCLQNLAEPRSASPKETRQKNKLLIFFLLVPSRITHPAEFIYGRCCNAETCRLNVCFTRLDVHRFQWNCSSSPKRCKEKVSAVWWAAQLREIAPGPGRGV